MKLQLTLPALERLLGGDSELEAELRYNIVEQFTKKHIKTILNDETFKKIEKEFKEFVNGQIRVEIDRLRDNKQKLIDNNINNADVMRNVVEGYGAPAIWDIKKAIEQYVATEVEQCVRKTIESQKRYFVKTIEDEVKKAININIAKLVDEGIRQRLAIASAIEDMSGLTSK